MSGAPHESRIEADFFDGRSARPQPAWVTAVGTQLLISPRDGAGVPMRAYDLDRIEWPEPTRSGGRMLRLPDGASLHARGEDPWHGLRVASGTAESMVVRWQRSPARIAFALLMLLVVGVLSATHGVPALSQLIVRVLPEQIDIALGPRVLEQIDDSIVGPSQLDAATRERLLRAFTSLMRQARPDGTQARWTLEFRASRVGPNAFALPGGIIVLTDELVALADDDIDMVLGVLAHEMGHVEERHVMQSLVRSTLLTAIIGAITGDAGGLLVAAPALFTQLEYSREFERAADDTSIEIMRAGGISPAVMAEFFRRIEREYGDDDEEAHGLESWFSTHPASAERIRKFEEAAR